MEELAGRGKVFFSYTIISIGIIKEVPATSLKTQEARYAAFLLPFLWFQMTSEARLIILNLLTRSKTFSYKEEQRSPYQSLVFRYTEKIIYSANGGNQRSGTGIEVSFPFNKDLLHFETSSVLIFRGHLLNF
jgi:hypothetical protein